MTEFYSQSIEHAFGFMPLHIQAMASVVDTPAEVANSGNGTAAADLSNFGLVDDELQTRYEGARYSVEIEDWWLGVDIVTKKLQAYTWTRDGQLYLTFHYNDAFFLPRLFYYT